MKSQVKTIVITVAITVIVLLAAFYFLMPVFGPRFMHPLMSERMHGNSSQVNASDLDTSTEKLTENGAFKVSFKRHDRPLLS